MMKRHLLKMAAAVLLLSGGFLSAGTTSVDPVINFGITAPQGGLIEGWTPGVKIRMGAATEIVNGPFGAKALKFNGQAASRCKFEAFRRIRVEKNFSISFALRLDQAGGSGDTGLGVVLDGNSFAFTSGTFSLPARTQLKENQWYQIAVVYAADRKEAKLYVDGVLDNAVMNRELTPLALNFGEIGAFDGALASIQVWNRALTDKEMLQVTVDDAGLNTVRNKLEETGRNVKLDTVAAYLDDVSKTIVRQKNQRRSSVQAYERTAALAMSALSIAENEWVFRNTGLEKAPFALMQISATAPYLRSAYNLPEDAVYTTELRVAAAKGEAESFSFMLHPYEDVADLTLTVSGFKTADGKTLPASILDRKVVRNWYQADWNSQYNKSRQVLVPDLLLNDENLVRVDESMEKNFLRTSAGYEDINGMEKTAFNYCTADVKDAASLLPLPLRKSENKQFWFTVTVPADAKQGLYYADVTAGGKDGKVLGNFRIALRVYPFSLPEPKANYDRSKPYSAVLVGTDLARYTALSGQAYAEKLLTAELNNMKAHGITNAALPYAKNPAIFAADVKIRKNLGFMDGLLFAAAVPDDGSLLTQVGFSGKADAGVVSSMLNMLENKNVVFYGDPGLAKSGKNVLTYGDPEQAVLTPRLDIYHAQPYEPDDYLTEKWHAMQGRIYSCGYLFAGPDNPDLIRRTFGMTLYRANYDGFLLPAYAGTHCWNERIQPGIYRNQSLAYPVKDGFVNTIAYAALREAIDDVRYVTLVRSLLDEAYRVNNREAVYAGKKAVSVFELLDTKVTSLDLMRMELADHIVTIMKRLGKELD